MTPMGRSRLAIQYRPPRPSRKALLTTDTELRLIAMPVPLTVAPIIVIEPYACRAGSGSRAHTW